MTLVLLSLLLFSATSGTTVLDTAPSTTRLPDPLISQDGKPIDTAAQWPARREEMRAVLLQYEYGHVPPAPGNVSSNETLNSGEALGGLSSLQSVLLAFGPEKGLTMRADLYLPANASAPLPAILRFGLGAEHAEAANARGYAFVCFEQTSLDPDTEGHDVAGPAQLAYPEYDWGSVAVWAWGASRVLDYLETLDSIDGSKVIITGHSRTGKAALLAGALDERFAMVVPNGSGAGGAAAFRNPPKKVETLELITRADRFKSWFQADFGQFADREEHLPFDQHFLRALVAPRPLLSTDAYGDQWCNPPGTQSAWVGAQPVFALLGAEAHNMIHFRAGNHDQLAEDVAVLLAVAEHHFRGVPLTIDLHRAPFPEQVTVLEGAAPNVPTTEAP